MTGNSTARRRRDGVLARPMAWIASWWHGSMTWKLVPGYCHTPIPGMPRSLVECLNGSGTVKKLWVGWTVSLYGSVEFGRERTVGSLSRQLKIER